MKLDRVRLGSGALPVWVHHEHQARWRYASNYCKNKIIVDCACGIGKGTSMFAKAGASQVYAFDLSHEAVEITKQRCVELANVTVMQASALALPLDNASIDIFISLETIEHIQDDQSFLNEVTRLLSADGIFICSTPNRAVTMPGKIITDKPWNPFHVREYNTDEFQMLLSERFNTVHILGQNAYSQWRISLLEKLGRLLPGHTGGRINSALKLPRFAYDQEHHHKVRDLPDHGACEYLVAVCKQPK